MDQTRDVILAVDEDGWWVAEVPSLPGCFTQVAPCAEALANAREAIASYLNSLALEALADRQAIAEARRTVAQGADDLLAWDSVKAQLGL